MHAKAMDEFKFNENSSERPVLVIVNVLRNSKRNSSRTSFKTGG
jgi:hypothetical protein